MRFEGYGPGDSAILVDSLTGDSGRAAAAIRAAFLGHGGRPGAPGSVSYLFREVGRLVFRGGAAQDSLAGAAWDAGAEDVVTGRDGVVEVWTDPVELEAVRSRLAQAGFEPVSSAVTWRTARTVHLAGPAAERMGRLLEALERLDDVQSIYTNAEVAGEVLESV